MRMDHYLLFIQRESIEAECSQHPKKLGIRCQTGSYSCKTGSFFFVKLGVVFVNLGVVFVKLGVGYISIMIFVCMNCFIKS